MQRSCLLNRSCRQVSLLSLFGIHRRCSSTQFSCQASVASIPFIGKITIALQFLFVQRRGSADKNNKYTQAAGQTVEKLAERAADDRWGLVYTPHQ